MSKENAVDSLPTLHFADAAAFRAWLAAHHATTQGVWLKIAKKGSAQVGVSYTEAVEEALCFGWIDSQTHALDDDFFVQKFTPWRAWSIWSKINVEKVNALIDQGRMQPAGMREVERAQADGRWDAAYSSQSKIEPPEDLLAALAQNPVAADNFAKLNSANRFAVLFRITTAKKPETRARRIVKMIEMLNAGGRLYG